MSATLFTMTPDDAIECIAALDIVLDQYRSKIARMKKPSPAFNEVRKKLDYVYQVKRRLELQQPIAITETMSNPGTP